MFFFESMGMLSFLFFIVLTMGCVIGIFIAFIFTKREKKKGSIASSKCALTNQDKVFSSTKEIGEKIEEFFVFQGDVFDEKIFYKQIEEEMHDIPFGVLLLTLDEKFLYANNYALENIKFNSLSELNSHEERFLPFRIPFKTEIIQLTGVQRPKFFEIAPVFNVEGKVFPAEVYVALLGSYKNSSIICLVFKNLAESSPIMKMNRALFERSPIPTAFLDSNMKILDLNQSLLDFFNVTDLNDPFLCEKNFFPDFQPNGESTEKIIFDCMGKATQKGSHLHEITFTNKIGEALPCRSTLLSCKYADKVLFCVTLLDLRPFLAKERELHFEKELLEQLLETSPYGVAIEQDGKVIWANSKFAELVACNVGEVFENCFELPTHYHELQTNITKKGYAHDFAVSMFDKEGNHRSIFYSGFFFIYKEKPSVLSWLVDLTATKRTQEAFAEARNEAEEGLRVKNSFLTHMSHEVRTPMNAILGMSYLCLQTNLDATQREYLNKLQHSAKALLTIFDDILDYTKMDSSEITIDKSAFRIDECLDGLVKQYAPVADRKNIELILDVESQVPRYLLGDGMRLSRVLNNIISNAIKFTEAGDVILSCKLIYQSEDYVYIRFSVSDTGIGIDEEVFGHIYDIFTQAEESMTRRYGGPGLGLPVAQKLVESMGGNLEIQSTPDVGSVFSFTLAFEHDLKKSDVLPVHVFDALDVVLIDDNPKASLSFSNMLENFSFNVEHANSGEKGILLLEKLAPEFKAGPIIAIDHKMRGLDGFETAKKIMQGYKSEHEPTIIILTNSTTNIDESMVVNAGIQMIMRKPITRKALYENLLLVDSNRKNLDSTHDLDFTIEDIAGSQVLLVEDNEINQEIAKAVLSSMGMDVYIANNGLEALNIVQEKSYDIIFMDIQMPEMDGLTATKEIRTLGISTPIMAMTAHAQESDKAHSFAAGMNGHLTKPLDPDLLAQTLVSWIQPKKPIEKATRVGKPLVNIPPVLKEDDEIIPQFNVQISIGTPDPSNDSAGSINAEKHFFDPEKGMNGVGGEQDFYIKLLGKFKASYADAVVTISDAITSGNNELASRSLHTLKGLSASLGMMKLSQYAISLEQAHKLEQDIIPLMPTLNEYIEETIKRIDAYLLPFEREAVEVASQNISFQTLDLSQREGSIAILEELLNFLESDWEEVMLAMQKLKESLAQTLYEARLKSLDENIENFDIPEAFSICNTLIQELGEYDVANQV